MVRKRLARLKSLHPARVVIAVVCLAALADGRVDRRVAAICQPAAGRRLEAPRRLRVPLRLERPVYGGRQHRQAKHEHPDNCQGYKRSPVQDVMRPARRYISAVENGDRLGDEGRAVLAFDLDGRFHLHLLAT